MKTKKAYIICSRSNPPTLQYLVHSTIIRLLDKFYFPYVPTPPRIIRTSKN